MAIAKEGALGHKNGSLTRHYSGAELGQLIEAANKVSATDPRGPVPTILKREAGVKMGEVTQRSRK